VHLTGLYFIAQ